MRDMLRRNFLVIAFSGILVLVSGVCQAIAQKSDSAFAGQQTGKKSIYGRIWEVPRLYENKNNKVIQEFSIIGRYHGQYWSVNADQGKADGWENRRIYLGTEAVLFHNFTVNVQIKISEDFNPFYNGLYQAFVKWAPSKAFSVSAGRLDFLFAGLERTVSSTRIITIERGLLEGQILPHEVVGAVSQGNSGKVTWRAGLFSGNIQQEFTNFSGGFGAVAGLGYELPLFYREGSLHLDYLYNNGNPEDNALEPYNHIVSLWHRGQSGPFGMDIQLIAAHGIQDRKSVTGLTIMPTYILLQNMIFKGDALELVLRYQYAGGDGVNGLVLQQRYEQKIVPNGQGDHYNAIYAGLDWLIYEHRFKLMTGVEYSAMKDSANDGGEFSGWSYMAGIRVYF